MPYLTIISDMESRQGLSKISFPPAFMEKIYEFFKIHTAYISHQMTELKSSRSQLSRKEKDDYEWVETKVTVGSMLSAFIANMSGDKYTKEQPSNPIPEHTKESSQTSERNVCGNPVCYNHQNLKACSRCHLVWYCGQACQRSNWAYHKPNCKKHES